MKDDPAEERTPSEPENDNLQEELPEIEEAAESEGLVPKIKAEIGELQGLVQSFGLARFKDGTWFDQFLRTVLKPYSEKILKNGGVGYFRRKYPGFTREMLAQKLCETAAKYAMLAGGASGVVSSTAFAATIGTAGGASVVMVPAGLVTILAETLWTVRLQLRLVYDLYLLQDYPIDLEDPEDMYKAFYLTYGVQFATDTAGGATKALTPEAARSLLRSVIHGNTKLIKEMAAKVLGPKIGRTITQKAILRTAVPVVSVGISAGWNYLTTKGIGQTVRQELRCLGHLRDTGRLLAPRLAADPEASATVLEALLAIITADRNVDLREQELFRHISAFLEVPASTVANLEKHTDIEPTSVAARLSQLRDRDFQTALRDLLEVAAAADGRLEDTERRVLMQFEEALGFEYDEASVLARATSFQKDETAVRKAVQSARKAAVDAGQIVAGTGKRLGGWASGLLKKKPAPAEEIPGPSVASGADPFELLDKLARLRDAGVLTEEEFAAKKAEVLKRL